MTGKVSTEGWGPCWERRMGSLGTAIEPWLCYNLLFCAWPNCAWGGITPFEEKDTRSQRGKQLTPRVISIHNSKPIWHQLPKRRLFKDLCGYFSLSHPPGSLSFPHAIHPQPCLPSRCSFRQSKTESHRPKLLSARLPAANGFLGNR